MKRLKRIIRATLIMLIAAILLFIGGTLFGYLGERQAYIDANTPNTGKVVEKNQEEVGPYKITIERYTTNSSGETTTKTQTHTLSHEDWSKIEIGYIATFNEDGSIDINPPVEGEEAGQTEGKTDDYNTGMVVDKSRKSNYKIVVERYTYDTFGEVTTNNHTYTVSHDEWNEIEVGYIATYNGDGTIDIAPAGEEGEQGVYQPPKPYGQTYAQYLTGAVNNILSSGDTEDKPSSFVTIISLLFALIIFLNLCKQEEKESSATTNAEAAKNLEKFLHPYADEEDHEDKEEEEDMYENEKSFAQPNANEENEDEAWTHRRPRNYSVVESEKDFAVNEGPAYLYPQGAPNTTNLGACDEKENEGPWPKPWMNVEEDEPSQTHSGPDKSYLSSRKYHSPGPIDWTQVMAEEPNLEPPKPTYLDYQPQQTHEPTSALDEDTTFVQEQTPTFAQAPESNQNQPSASEEGSLTVRQIRSLVDQMTQLEIVEYFKTLASDYNYSLTKDYDHRTVKKLSVSNIMYTQKLVLELEPKSSI